MPGQPHVLLVDDNDEDTQIFIRAFSRAAPDVPLHSVRSGAEALDFIKGVDRFADRSAYPLPSLLIVDLNMPGVDGFAVIRWVRDQAELRHVPIIVLSSSNEHADISRAHKLGANACHMKPTNSEALSGLVEGLKVYWLNQQLQAARDQNPAG